MPLSEFSQVLGNFGEFVGAIAVVATLFYLAIQVKQSKEATKANTQSLQGRASWDAEVVWADRNEAVAKDSEYAELVQRIFNPDGNLESFSEAERAQVFADTLSVLQRVQAQYFLWQAGVLPNEIWEYRSMWARRYISLPIVATIWEDLKSEDLLSRVFIDTIERIPASTLATLSIGTATRV